MFIKGSILKYIPQSFRSNENYEFIDFVGVDVYTSVVFAEMREIPYSISKQQDSYGLITDIFV